MIKALQSELSINVIASIIGSLLFLVTGFLWGKYKERRREFGRNLEEYDFYPFTVTRENFGEFSPKDFRLGLHYFLKNEDRTAARQLIFIGEQNNVRGQLEPAEQKVMPSSLIITTGKKLRMTQMSIWRTTFVWCVSSGNHSQILASRSCFTI